MRSTQLLFAWRMLRKNPATSALAVIALAVGIGLTTTVFSMVHGVLLGRLPFADPGRLVDLVTYDLDTGPLDFQSPQVSAHDFLDWRDRQTSFEGLAAYAVGAVNLNDEAGYPGRRRGAAVTWNTFRVLGVWPAIGRDFGPEDDLPGAAPVVLLGDDLWRQRFAGDPAIVGRTIRVDGEPATVVGVMPPGIEFPTFEELWQPLGLDVAGIDRDESRRLWVIGRLRDGMGRDRAQAELSTLNARLAETYPETNAGFGVAVRDYRRSLNSAANNALLGVMFGAVSLVLVIVCANVASLLLARATLRARELAIRTALGAPRWRVVGLLLAESLVLSVLGAVLGLGLAHAATRWLERAFAWQTLPFGSASGSSRRSSSSSPPPPSPPASSPACCRRSAPPAPWASTC